MVNFKSILKLGLGLVFIAITLTSCSNKRAGGIVLVSNCPAVGLVEHLNALTLFDGETYTNRDVVFDAYITDLDVSCTQGSSVVSDISFSIRAKKGPAFKGTTYNLTYYVVIIRDNYQLTNKKTFTTQINFKPGSDTTGVREHLRQTFASYEQPKRYNYEILIGFELTPEELEFNVARQAIPN